MSVIGYAYDADHHCEDCTIQYIVNAYGIEPYEVAADFDGYEDSEGNPIHPIFDTEEWYANALYEGKRSETLNCSDCGRELDVWEAT